MAWTPNLDFVSVGDPVTRSYITEFLGNLEEDDVAKATSVGQLLVGTGIDTRPGEMLDLGPVGHVLESRVGAAPQWVAPTSLSSDFVTGQEFKLFIQS